MRGRAIQAALVAPGAHCVVSRLAAGCAGTMLLAINPSTSALRMRTSLPILQYGSLRRRIQARMVLGLSRRRFAASATVNNALSAIASLSCLQSLLNCSHGDAPPTVNFHGWQLGSPNLLVKIVQSHAQPSRCGAWRQISFLVHVSLSIDKSTPTAHTVILLECFMK